MDRKKVDIFIFGFVLALILFLRKKRLKICSFAQLISLLVT